MRRAVGQRPLRRGGLRRGWGGGGASEQFQRGLRAQVAAGRGDFFQVPGHRADDGAARSAGFDGAAHQQEPGVEHGVRDVLVGVLEEGDVDQARAVLQCHEDDPLAGRDRRGLGGGPYSGDQDRLSGDHCAEVGGVGGAELAQEPVVVLHQMLAHVDGEGVEFGAEFVAAGHLRQAARGRGDEFSAQRQLPVGGGAVAVLPVEFGCLQQQVAAGQVCRELIEGADADQALRKGQGRAGALPQVLQVCVGLAGREAGGLGRGDALDGGEGEPDDPPLWGLFDAVPGPGAVDVDGQDGNAVAAGVGDQDAARPHARVVLEQPRIQIRREVRLQICGLQGRDGEGDRVRAAEAVRAEGGHGLPHLVQHGLVVAALAGSAAEPGLDLGQPVAVGQGAAGDVGGGAVASGHLRQDRDDLLVPDHHPVGVVEDRLQVRVRVAGRGAVTGRDEQSGHTAGDRAGPEEADVGDDVLHVPRLQPPHQVLLARGLELEQAHSVRGLDEFEGKPVVEVDVVGVVEIELAAGGAADLGDGMCHRRLHPHPQDVELEQSEVFDVLLVGLHHRVAARGGLHRQPLQQTRVGQDDAAGVHGVAAGQRVQAFGQLPQRPELPGPGGKLAQFRQLGQGAADVPRADVRERLGDLVHDLRGQPEGEAGVAQGVAGSVGLGHAGDCDPVAPEPFDDLVVDVQASGRLHIQVDVRKRGPPLAQKAFEQQPVLDRVGRGHEQAVVDHGPGAGATRGDPDSHRPYIRHDLGHGQEVALEAQAADHVELVAELPHGALVGVQAAGEHARLAALPQQPHRRTGLRSRAHDGRLGKVRPPQPEIGRGERAGLAGRLRLGQQTRAPVPVAADSLGDPLGGRCHRGRVLQPALAAVQVPAVDGPQQPRRIEHVGEPVLSGVGVADRVGQHHGHTELIGQAHGPRGQPQRSRTGSLTAQIHALQAQARPCQLPPRREQLLGDVDSACGQGPYRLGPRTEQDHQAGVGELAQDRPGHDRQASVRLGVRGGHEAAQPCPPGEGLREQSDPQRRLRHVRAAAYGRTRPTGCRVGRGDGGDGDVDTEDGADAGGRGGLGEADRARDGVPVGQRERRHPTLDSTPHEGMGEGGAVAGRIAGSDAQMSKSTASHLRLSRVPP